MKGGKKKTGEGSSSDAAQEPPLSPPSADGGGIGEVDFKPVHSGDDESAAAVTSVTAAAGQDEEKQDEQRQEEGEGGGEESSDEGEEEEEEGEEGEKCFDKFEHIEIAEGDAETERPKLAEGFYEIEAVRRKRVRKGEVQYLIKWRGWPETANTWEPVENLLSCSDVIEAFEESLQSGKLKSSRGRKRKYANTRIQSKKKQQTSPAAASYNVPAVKVRIIDEPLPMSPLDNSNVAVEGDRYVGGANIVRMARQAKENGVVAAGSTQIEEMKEQNELGLKLRELRGTMTTSDENVDKSMVSFHEANALEGDGSANGLSKVDSAEQGQPGRCTGAKRRKSGSVKRFKLDSALGPSNDSPNATRTTTGLSGRVGWQVSQLAASVGNEMGHRNKFDISKNMTTITDIIKPISYSSALINNALDVSVTFMAMRSDGKEVVVDNKFLKANYPLLLINFYEQHLRYSPT